MQQRLPHICASRNLYTPALPVLQLICGTEVGAPEAAPLTAPPGVCAQLWAGEGDPNERLLQVCGSAGDTTTLRSVEPPYSYSSKESRRAARKRAAIFAQLIQEEGLEISNASPWPGGWQSRISAQNHKVPTHEASCLRSVWRDI